MQHYSFTDPSAMTTISYYRLKIVDADGSFSYSAIRFIEADSHAGILVDPNPAVQTIAITIPASWQHSATRIQVIDTKGAVVIDKISTDVQNVINVQKLQTGLYLVRATNNKSSEPLLARFAR